MKPDPDEFQAICMGKITHDATKQFQMGVIQCETNVTLLGVNIDFMLSSSGHVSDRAYVYSYVMAVYRERNIPREIKIDYVYVLASWPIGYRPCAPIYDSSGL